MPKAWLYMLAALLPMALRIAVLNTPSVDWLWYHQHVELYNLFNALRVQPQFLEFIGGWALPLFTITVLAYWSLEDNYDSIPEQFLMLPIAYLPFTILGEWLVRGEFSGDALYTHPLIILPVGYAYVFIWAAFIKILDTLRLVL